MPAQYTEICNKILLMGTKPVLKLWKQISLGGKAHIFFISGLDLELQKSLKISNKLV